jgi:hypothetical protein
MKAAPQIEWNSDVWSEKQTTTSDFTTLFFYRHQRRDRLYTFIYWLEGKVSYELVSEFDDVTQHFVHHQAQLHDRVLWSWRRKDILGATRLHQTLAYPGEVLDEMLSELKKDGWEIYGFSEDPNRKRFILNR